MKDTILLHTCCGPCVSAAALELLKSDAEVILFFSNSNIDTEQEYEKRLFYAKKVANQLGIPIIADPWEHLGWLAAVKGFEKEPEKGKRCEICFHFSLQKTADYVKKTEAAFFTSSLTISPHKSSATINRIGMQMPNFLENNFKKNNGFQRSIELSTQYGLYRQNYCGCEFSRHY